MCFDSLFFCWTMLIWDIYDRGNSFTFSFLWFSLFVFLVREKSVAYQSFEVKMKICILTYVFDFFKIICRLVKFFRLPDFLFWTFSDFSQNSQNFWILYSQEQVFWDQSTILHILWNKGRVTLYCYSSAVLQELSVPQICVHSFISHHVTVLSWDDCTMNISDCHYVFRLPRFFFLEFLDF